MSIAHMIFLAVIFLTVAGVVLVAMLATSSVPLRDRLQGFRAGDTGAGEGDGRWIERVARVARPFSKLSLPEEGWERSPLRTRFINAGWRHPSAPAIYFAAKTILTILLPLAMAVLLAGSSSSNVQKVYMLLLCCAAGIGYYLPNGLLSRMAERRQREIFENLPDALDLLTICVEAGLSMERALGKVAGEIHVKSLVLAQELQLVLMELRAGFSKEKALRNLALRSGVEDVDTLVAMLIQSERFGTSMGDSLRVHSDNLRLKRSLMAEEAAARIALKLLFPLIFCIFPTLMLVLLGPAAIQMSRVLLPSLSGGQ
ncbi:type II secretion system F family protein [Massilia sp. SM-13]|uniref:type II secretion system F family protein n=1 Tax=Pseudoduganella rhizocola TaxID=3382643 RepID=UPI0038B68F9C